jgi:putative flippase GtrA
LAGSIGFLVDIFLLYQFVDFLGVYIARILSFSGAVFSTWIINRNYAFHEHSNEQSLLHEFMIYYSCMIFGGAVNYIFYIIIVSQFNFSNYTLLIAVAIGSVSGIAVNFWTSKYVVFKI